MNRNEVDREKLSPMMKQYMEIKDKHEDELLFYRLGDFYELFFEDGKIAARELELTLTGKNAGLSERVPMCGVPHHSVKPYIKTLVEKGYKVAIAEQLEDPKDVKGTVKRGVVDVVSKSTFVDEEYLDNATNCYIGGVISFEDCYLLSFADISTGVLNALYIEKDDSKLLNEILKLGIREIITIDNFPLKLISTLENNYGILVTESNEMLQNEYRDLINSVTDERIKMGIRHLFYYLVKKELKDVSHIDHVNILNNEETLYMDIHTIRNLELFETIRLKERNFSLIWLLDKCKTAMGRRKLKDMLLHPLLDINKINKRLDYVEKLINEFITREKLRDALEGVYDIERLCGKVICGSLNAKDLLQLKNSLKNIPEIKKLIDELSFDINIDENKEIYNLLEKSIYENPPVSIKEGYLIKEGYNKELDELKNIRSGGKDFIATLEESERNKTGIKTLKVGFNKVFGYYIEISKGQVKEVKDEWGWERRQTLSTSERYITPILKEKEALVLNSEEKIIKLEYELFLEIKEKVKKEIFKLKTLADNLSQIDAYLSLATVAIENSFVRPKFNNDNTINIIGGKHPVVDNVTHLSYVANDCIMDKDTSTLLITGPNMAGKSTYMRQLAIIIIMAQIGSFVPCEECNLKIIDKIYTRIGASDDLVSGESTFMVEMLEAKNAIEGATENSLILFDELGRGTSTYDGMSLAESILEYVNTKINCKTLFSTHYHELTSLSKKYPTIKNVHVCANFENDNLTFLHKVKDGPTDKSYGIQVASLAGLPDSIIKNASEHLKKYEQNKPRKMNEQISFTFPKKENELKKEIDAINILNITPMEAMNILYKLKEKSKDYEE